MKLAIMQPYLFPYIGYWQLINAVDTFIVYDNIEFSKKSWFNRNYILINGKKKLFTIPLKKSSDKLNVIDRILSNEKQTKVKKILAQIENNYRNAPYFNCTFPFVKGILEFNEENLFKYTYNSITKTCNYLNIKTQIVTSSNININHDLKSQDKVLDINKSLNSSHYINSIGGIELYDSNIFQKENIKLSFLKSELPQYQQFKNKFIPYLSIIDIMMFNSKEKIKSMLLKYKLT